MRISDWSSDVCSSDLWAGAASTRVHQPLELDDFSRAASQNPFVLSLSKHRSSRRERSRAYRRTALRQAQGERINVKSSYSKQPRRDIGVDFGDRKSTRLNSSH